MFFHSRKQSFGPNPTPLPFFLLGKTELAKQTAKYMHKDAKKVSAGMQGWCAGHGDLATAASPPNSWLPESVSSESKKWTLAPESPLQSGPNLATNCSRNLSKLSSILVPQFTHLWNRKNNPCPAWLLGHLGEPNEIHPCIFSHLLWRGIVLEPDKLSI